MQFSLKHAVTATTVIAVICAMVAPFLRQLTPEQLADVEHNVSAFALACVLVLVAFAIYHSRIKSAAGRLLFQMLRRGRAVAICMMGLLLGLTLWRQWEYFALPPNPMFGVLSLFDSFTTGAIVGLVVAMQWLGWNEVSLHERGIVLNDLRFRPWAQVRYHWTNDNLTLSIWRTSKPAKRQSSEFQYAVPSDLRAKLQAILDEHATSISQDSVPTAQPVHE